MSLGVPGHIGGDFEIAMSHGSIGVDHPFRNALSVKMSQLLQHMHVLHGDRSPVSSGNAVLVVGYGRSPGSRELVFSFVIIVPPLHSIDIIKVLSGYLYIYKEIKMKVTLKTGIPESGYTILKKRSQFVLLQSKLNKVF
jgi:hypothetical protein